MSPFFPFSLLYYLSAYVVLIFYMSLTSCMFFYINGTEFPHSQSQEPYAVYPAFPAAVKHRMYLLSSDTKDA